MKHLFCIAVVTFILFGSSCYRPPSVKNLRNTESIATRTLFIALDGVDYAVVKELYDEGYFHNFLNPIPFVSTFPSDTTVGFTGIFQPIDVGRVPGYESRFYSYKENKVIGGTLKDIHRIPFNYKFYFDAYRHQTVEKAVMYAFPGMAGKEDLVSTEKALFGSDKKILLTYLGGTDGSSHLLGRKRTKNFLKFMDRFLVRLQKRYRENTGEELRIVLFSDHGFHHKPPRMITAGDLKKKLAEANFNLVKSIRSDRDVLVVPFGLLSSGVLFTPLAHRKEIARTVAGLNGVDLVFWHDNSKKHIHILNSKGETARFEYKGSDKYRYVSLNGDPLHYNELIRQAGHKPGEWLKDKLWRKFSHNHYYPDAGYRLYDSFFHLVENPANIMFSTHSDYQFGSTIARIGTFLKFGHKGTHGGLFQSTSYGLAMTTRPGVSPWPSSLRYDELFNYFLPDVTKAYKKNGKKSELSIILSPENRHTH